MKNGIQLIFERLKIDQMLCEPSFGHMPPWWGPPSRPRPQRPPLHLSRDRQPPCPLVDPIFLGKEVESSNLICLSKTDTLPLNSKFCEPVVGGRTILPMPLHQYGCGQGIATNAFPPNEGPPLSLLYQTKVNKGLKRKRITHNCD